MITAENSLAVQWLGLSPFNTVAGVQSLVRELRSHKPRGTAKHKQTNKNDHCIQMVVVILLITLQLSEFQYPLWKPFREPVSSEVK